MQRQTDEDLIRRIVEGDEEAFMALHDRYGGFAYSLARRILGDSGEAEDAVQEAFISVWRMSRSFDGRRGTPRAWLLSVVHHRCIDGIRRRRGQKPLELFDDIRDGAVGDERLWKDVSVTLDREAIVGALARIPEEQRRVIEMAYFEGYTYREIAEGTGVPLGTVKGRMRIGLEKLRDLLRGIEGTD